MIPVERLKTIPIFAQLDDEELARLTPLFHHAHYRIGEILTTQGDPGDSFFVLDRGTLRVRYVDSKDRESVLGYLNAPAFFGETSLFTGLNRDVTIDVFSPEADLLVLPKHEFDALLNEFPKIKQDLIMRSEVQKKLAQRLYPWLAAGEIVLVNTRRHWYALVSRLLLPEAIALVLFVAALVVYQINLIGNPNGGDTPLSTASAILLTIGLLWGGLAGLWIGLDWSNDYYIITNKRVIHIEKVIFFFDEREEALIEQITNVIEASEGVTARVFGYTEIRVETAGRQIDVNFSYAPKSKRIPQHIFEQLNRLKDRVALEKRERLRAGIREDLWNRLAPEVSPEAGASALSAPPPPPRPAAAALAAPAKPAPKRRIKFTPFGDRFTQAFGLRVEGPSQVTWRKHWVVLLEHVDEPIVAIAILLIVGALNLSGLIPVRVLDVIGSSILNQLLLVIFWILLLLAAGVWLWYQYEDWSNDIYRVTDDRLIDIERNPLGLHTRSTETTLDRVQDVSYVNRGVLANLFNFGDLIIETAGAGRITFYGITDPKGAIQEIFRRRDAHRSNSAREAAVQERRQYLDWFMEYHRFLVEQGAISPSQPRSALVSDTESVPEGETPPGDHLSNGALQPPRARGPQPGLDDEEDSDSDET